MERGEERPGGGQADGEGEVREEVIQEDVVVDKEDGQVLEAMIQEVDGRKEDEVREYIIKEVKGREEKEEASEEEEVRDEEKK